MNELSTKTHILMMSDHSKIFITKVQADKIKQELQAGAKWVEVEGSFIREFVITKIIGASEYKELERTKRGEWKCKCGQWIPKGKQCGKCQA